MTLTTPAQTPATAQTPAAARPETGADQPATTDLRARFGPVLAEIAGGAVRREQERTLPFEAIGLLREAGFGRLRVPQEYGGFGATLEQFFDLLIDLGAADSNVPQALRGHIGFTELALAHPDAEYRARWLTRIGQGALFGNAESERSGTFAEQQTTVTRRADGSVVLNGTKYYTTGSIFADWIFVSAALDGPAGAEREFVTVQVDRHHPGVRITDDWDGFGQRLTGSGTAVFTDVPVDPGDVQVRGSAEFTLTTVNAIYQLVHLANLAGLAQAGLDEISAFVVSRPRNLYNPKVAFRQDPAALLTVGETYGAVQVLRAAVLDAARTTDAVTREALAGTATEQVFARADAHVYGIQGVVIDLALRTLTRIFEVGGASATAQSRQLDRLWRNARTIASHNPALHRTTAVGDWRLNGVSPASRFLALLAPDPEQG